MLPVKRSKLTMEILGKLREKGAPQMTPFPGEQSFENQGEDISPDGSIVGGAIPPELLPKKKKKPVLDDENQPAIPPANVIGGY